MGKSPYDRPGESPIHVDQHSGRRPYAQIILYAALATVRHQVSLFGPPLDPSSTACRVRTAYPLRCRSEYAQLSLGAMQYRAPLTRFMARLRYEQTYASYAFVQHKASDSTMLVWEGMGSARRRLTNLHVISIHFSTIFTRIYPSSIQDLSHPCLHRSHPRPLIHGLRFRW